MRDDDETAATPVASGVSGLVGSVVDERYRLTGVLGQGAMAGVYRALDERLDREVAVKLFHPGQDAAVRSRFAAEAQALARLSHSGLVAIYDAGVEGDRSYLVMQLVDGETLRERLLAGPLDADAVALLGARLAMALAHVHGNDVVHRDVKPSNIVLDGNGSPHLADFGIALLLDAARMTTSSEIMGTAAYLSPEQILGVEVGKAADIYSLGLVLLECLTGELEYPGVSKVESAVARLHRPPRVPDTVPPVLAELLTAMTALVPENRPAAGECAAWFWAVRDHSGVTTKAVRLAAVRWLSTKGKQLGRSRTWAPLFSGWRRFAIAGSGLAMAVLASTWLFTSLLPKVMPAPPYDGAILPQQTAGSHPPQPKIDDGGHELHIAAAVTTSGSAPATGSSTPITVTVTDTVGSGTPTEVVIVSTLTGFASLPPPSGGGASSDPPTLQDSSVNDAPGSSVPTSADNADPSTTSTTTADNSGQGSGDQGGDQGSGDQGSGGQGPGGPDSSATSTDPSVSGTEQESGDSGLSVSGTEQESGDSGLSVSGTERESGDSGLSVSGTERESGDSGLSVSGTERESGDSGLSVSGTERESGDSGLSVSGTEQESGDSGLSVSGTEQEPGDPDQSSHAIGVQLTGLHPADDGDRPAGHRPAAERADVRVAVAVGSGMGTRDRQRTVGRRHPLQPAVGAFRRAVGVAAVDRREPAGGQVPLQPFGHRPPVRGRVHAVLGGRVGLQPAHGVSHLRQFGGHGHIAERLDHGHATRCSSTCSINATRIALTDSRLRASQWSTGIALVHAERLADLVEVEAVGTVEPVHRDDERRRPVLEVVQHRVAVLDPSGVGDDHRAEGAVARSSQRKSNRSWPGVPNRYRINDRSSVIRPKSSATVVVVFWLSSEASSTPTDRSVIAASVTSGSISEIAPMKVVLPTPNPPLITILTAEGRPDGRSQSARTRSLILSITCTGSSWARATRCTCRCTGRPPAPAPRRSAPPGGPPLRRARRDVVPVRRSDAARTAAARTRRPVVRCTRVSIRRPSCSGRVRPR